MEIKLVAVTDHAFPDLRQEKEVLEPEGIRVVAGQCKTPEEVIGLCSQADAILTQWAPITKEVIERLEKCKIIVRYGIGVDNVDLEAARNKKIPVVNVPDYAIDEVADHAITLALSSMRKIQQVTNQVRSGIWNIAPCRPIKGFKNCIFGLAGFGNIARAVAERAKTFGFKVIAYDPFVDKRLMEAQNVEKVDWEHLLALSDIISIHLPLNGDTRHLFNQDAFFKMKPASFIVNTSRGGVVHTADLVRALHSGALAGAALDVLEEEPIAHDHPLLPMDNCILTSHCAWYSEQSLQKLQLYAALEVRRMFSGEKPKHIVNGL